MSCKKCGMCCRAIVCNHSLAMLEARDDDKDKQFVLDNWVLISREEALSRNPELKDVVAGDHFYECKLLDTKTNLCTQYASRPWACEGFPWYIDTKPNPKALYWSKCGYLEDCKKKE